MSLKTVIFRINLLHFLVALNHIRRGQRKIHIEKGAKDPGILQAPILVRRHTINLMALRFIFENFGLLAVLNFDSQIDSWFPKVLGGGAAND